MIKSIIKILLLIVSFQLLYSQVEHVQVIHPVYSFLLRAESKGLLPHYSLSSLPLQRSEIIKALEQIRKNAGNLSQTEISVLQKYETEFQISQRDNAVIFFSLSDSTQVLSTEMFGNREKFIYHYRDSLNQVSLSPLGSIESIIKFEEDKPNRDVIFGNLGVRLFGTIDGTLGYYLQATNGVILSGEKILAQEDKKLRKNIKFIDLNSDFDFSESHVRYQNNWFYAIMGRETKLLGAGLNQRLIVSDNAPPFDAVSLGAKFSNFEYRFTQAGIIGLPTDQFTVGIGLKIPDKYASFHRFALKPEWGEIAFWEAILYSGRNFDLAYLNPLSFFKSLEHALRDRDNSIMGMDATIRPVKNLQVKGTYFLDDIKFSEIGKGYWSNKSAWNIAVISSLPLNLDFGLEYTRIEPYTFSHFNPQNSYTNDSLLIGSYLKPNSEEWAAKIQYWWGNRYPIAINISYSRHGDNIVNDSGKVIRNVGGDPLLAYRYGDSETVTFLDGNLVETLSLQVSSGFEIIRGFSIQALYGLNSRNGKIDHSIRMAFRFEDF